MMEEVKGVTPDNEATTGDTSDKHTWVGQAVLRREDRRLLTGAATFAGDIPATTTSALLHWWFPPQYHPYFACIVSKDSS